MTEEIVDKVVTELIFEIPQVSKAALEEYKKLRNIERNKFQSLNIPLSNINKIRNSLFKSGFTDSFNMSEFEAYKTHEDFLKQKNIDKQEAANKKAKDKEESNFRKEALANEKERTDFAKRAFYAVRGIGIAGALISTVKSAYGAVTTMANDSIAKYRDSSIFSNMGFKRSQGLRNFIEKRGADPEDVLSTIRRFKLKTNRSKMTDEDALLEFIKGINKPGANLAGISAAYGASPSMIDSIRGLSSDEFKKGINEETNKSYITESDIALFKEFNKNVLSVSSAFEESTYTIKKFSAEMVNSFFKINDFLTESYSKYLNFAKGVSQSFSLDSIVKWFNKLNDNSGAENKIKEKSSQDVVINQNFNIKSTDPEGAAEEIRSRMNEGDYAELMRGAADYNVSAVR